MSGLPVLMMGANAALLALIALVQLLPNMTVIASSAAMAVLLILLAFRIRAGHAAWLPFVLVLYGAFMIAGVHSSRAGWPLSGQTPVSDVLLLLNWVVPIICSVLMIGGLRGWLWMRSNEVKVSF